MERCFYCASRCWQISLRPYKYGFGFANRSTGSK
uniref:Uncharacterized protein n=1 Tax=Anguilla anguilla TaxID=7936 RepID=A0A0E9V5R0_ANGAN